jgi:hypothetical protein
MIKTIKEIEYKYIVFGLVAGLALLWAFDKWKEKKSGND